MSTGPVESKVKAATTGAAIAGVVVWVLESYVFHSTVPAPIQALLDIAIPGVVAFAAGYVARHTFRNDPDAVTSGEAPPPAVP